MLRDPLSLLFETTSLAAHRSTMLEPFGPPHLLSPPSMPADYVPGRHTQLSPLCPPNATSRSRERSHFEAMLHASRERSAMLGAKKPLGLRKEIAVKAQKGTQLERRARFLNKLCEPPSPSAADCPVTPPESPTLFHFTLPSPGLQSPSELFEDVLDHPERYRNTKRVEQVDFRDRCKKRTETCVRLLPSLDQISQRLNKGPVSCNLAGSPFPERDRRAKSRLPSFLQSRSFSLSEMTSSSNDQPPKRLIPELPRLSLCPATPPGQPVVQSSMSQHVACLDLTPYPLDTGLVISDITMSPYSLPQPKLSLAPYPETTVFDSEQSGEVGECTATIVMDDIPTPDLRAQLTKDMFNKLSRRTLGFPNTVAHGIKARDDTSQASFVRNGVDDKTKRRCSAPARVPSAQRDAHHPVLEKPGGF